MTEKLTTITSRTVVLSEHNIDTDQIIPARFLATTERAGLGAGCFADARAAEPAHPLNAPDAPQRQVLIAGANFGCGSSREHAPWALYDFGFRAVLSSKLADIFKANALKNGVVALEIDDDLHQQLLATPGMPVTIDLKAQTIIVGNEPPRPFAVDPFARQCLMDGVDQLGFILAREPDIAAFEAARDDA